MGNPLQTSARFGSLLHFILPATVKIPDWLQPFFKQLRQAALKHSSETKGMLVNDSGQQVEVWSYPSLGNSYRPNTERYILMGFIIPQLPNKKLVFIFGENFKLNWIMQSDNSNASQCYPVKDKKMKMLAKAALTQFLSSAHPANEPAKNVS